MKSSGIVEAKIGTETEGAEQTCDDHTIGSTEIYLTWSNAKY